MEIREIFENYIKIEAKVMSIESLFNNEDRLNKTNYKPSYQRNYVWDDEKATYFIESILLGTEIPPLIYFRKSDKIEVIDGRQRYETILRFKNNEFKLKKNGLQRLDNIGIANKYFKSIDSKFKDLFWDTKLRIIEFSFYSKNRVNDEIEEVVKKEIFKRYNSGITPLRPTDIDRAAYIDDDVNSYFKKKLTSDQVLYDDISALLHFEKSNIEIILKKIRQLLVQHQIPVKYYSVKKDSVISKYFEFLSSNITTDEIEKLYSSFISKINILKQLRVIFQYETFNYNRLVFECIFWALSIVEVETGSLQDVDMKMLQDLSKYVISNKNAFKMERSSFSKELHHRYFVTSEFFKNKLEIDFNAYLQNTPEFKAKNQHIGRGASEAPSFDDLRINKPEPSSTAIDDICRQMNKQRFLIRPSYQRNEVINKKKSSAIIESILLGIKLPPIFVFKRKDDVSEVLDGQQRLLSILGFMKRTYLDENNKVTESNKNGYALNLRNGILKNLNGKTFDQLNKEDRDKITDFDLWVIEISEKNNENFESIDLFIRLNNKPYPIKEDTFEMWNSYISRDIIETIKAIHKNNNGWFYLRKNNSRMEDENIYTSLAYLQFQVNRGQIGESVISKYLDIYKIGDKINFRVKVKNEITRVLESNDFKDEFIKACFDFEFDFLKKLKILLSDSESESVSTINDSLDKIFNRDNNRRTQQSFYALWYFLYDIPASVFEIKRRKIREDLFKLFKLMDNVDSKASFDKVVQNFKLKYGSFELNFFERKTIPTVPLGGICSVLLGINQSHLQKYSRQTSSTQYFFVKEPHFDHLKVVEGDESEKISLDDRDESFRDFIDSKQKIILKRVVDEGSRLVAGITDEKTVFGPGFLMMQINRYGYYPKFILAVLVSRWARYSIGQQTSSLSDIERISIGAIKNISIPIMSLSEQAPFVKIVEYILNLSFEEGLIGFFERLLDVMIYELFFKEQMTAAGCDVLKYMYDAPEIENVDYKQTVILKYYEEISSSQHPISKAMLKLLNVTDIVEVEGHI